MTETSGKKSDLGVRVVSAIVMVAVAGTALWLGGWVWAAFVGTVALGVMWEWWGLVRAFEGGILLRGIWCACGVIYTGVAAAVLWALRLDWINTDDPPNLIGRVSGVLFVVLTVVGTAIGAYFAGRTIGGPKILPSVSPSKTWAGLVGGMIAASVTLYAALLITSDPGWMDPGNWEQQWKLALPLGIGAAIVAQGGDFFQSWMKRRAGVKDSGRLIPGHGGLFDRVDGLLAVCFVLGVLQLRSWLFAV